MYDPAAQVSKHKCADIIAEKFESGIRKWLVRWEGFEAAADTWEPIENLAGCEDFIARFNEEREKGNEEARAIQEQRLKLKRAADQIEKQKLEDIKLAIVQKHEQKMEGKRACKRTSPWWACFKDCEHDDKYAECELEDPDDPEQKCGTLINKSSGPTGLGNHVLYIHNAKWKEIDSLQQSKKGNVECNKAPNTYRGEDGESQTQLKGHWDPNKVAEIDEKLAFWVAKKNRPPELLEDKEFRDTWKDASHGAYIPPDHTKAKKLISRMAVNGMRRVIKKNRGRLKQGE